jgi:PAS domain S-box-containing protein
METAPSKASTKTPSSAGVSPATIMESTELFRLLVDRVRDYAIFALDTTGHVLSWNEGAQRLKGWSASEIIGRHFSTFYPDYDIATGKPAYELKTAVRDGRFEDEGWRIRKDGSRMWANVIITALFDDDGLHVGFAKVTRDLTERRAAQERALAEARRATEAEVANRAKSEFLAVMSHELRTPLNAIGGYAELIAMGIGGPVTAQQQDYLSRIRSSQQHLLGIITDLLNFSRIEAGQVAYDLGPASAQGIIDGVMPLISPQADAKRIALSSEPASPLLLVQADRQKAEQIVLNLMSNSIKFTPEGGRVRVRCTTEGAFVYFAVEDSGIGVPADKIAAIFEPFVQLGRSRTSQHEGTGLGLSISRDLARAMGGDITVQSTLDVGSTFTLALPRVA